MKKAVLSLLVVLVTGAPAFAQVELAGSWISRLHEDWQERGPGPEVFDNLGVPLNADGIASTLRYSQSALSMPERQCLYYSPHYVVIGPQALRIWSDIDATSGRIIAWNISAAIDRGIIKIWMDGRPHPSTNARHTLDGFTTGVWEGRTLTTTTTHFNQSILRRSGVPTSDKATFTMHITRHGDTLTITGIIDDPVYLTRSHIINRSWQLDPAANLNAVPNPCVPEAEIAELKGDGSVPHYLPGENPFATEVTKMYNIPLEAVTGGAETMFPEYRKKLKDTYVAPASCGRYCCGWIWGGNIGNAPGLQCTTSVFR